MTPASQQDGESILMFEHTMAALGAFLVAQTRHAPALVLGCCGRAAVDEEKPVFVSLFVCVRARVR
jgi:hypothetical protein